MSTETALKPAHVVLARKHYEAALIGIPLILCHAASQVINPRKARKSASESVVTVTTFSEANFRAMQELMTWRNSQGSCKHFLGKCAKRVGLSLGIEGIVTKSTRKEWERDVHKITAKYSGSVI